MYHQDNAPSHTSAVVMTKIHELRFELLDHPPYSPYLAPSNFFLSSHLKKLRSVDRGFRQMKRQSPS
ncbi:hypothetical protein TNCV_758571 [Trichonephila clavipes]|nr:hypothetical protein TNCV_758571 [Trichonephila clavipes]